MRRYESGVSSSTHAPAITYAGSGSVERHHQEDAEPGDHIAQDQAQDDDRSSFDDQGMWQPAKLIIGLVDR